MASVEVVLPVLNEENVLDASVRTLHAFLSANLAHEWRITIADNGSTDSTLEIARDLEALTGRLGAAHRGGRAAAVR